MRVKEIPDMAAPRRYAERSGEEQPRLLYIDSLRGLLVLIIIYHHIRCAFNPCLVFGNSVEWINDIDQCSETTQPYWSLLNPVTNGTFAMAAFFVLSGMVLAQGLWKAPSEKWRIVVAKRFFRLAIPCSVAMIFSYCLAGFSFHKEAAEVTNSLWLTRMSLDLPIPVGLLSQAVLGLWHGTATINKAMSTMSYELFGSYLVFGLVQLLKASSGRMRSRWLGALFLYLLVPSSSRIRKLQAILSYDIVKSLPGEAGQKRQFEVVSRKLAIDPIRHSHLLRQIDVQVHLSAPLTVNYTEQEPMLWYHSSTGQDGLQVLDQSSSSAENLQWYREVLLAADATQTDHTSPHLEIRKTTTWQWTNPWLWYAAIVAGVGLSDSGTARKASSERPMWMLAVGFLLASIPFTMTEQSSLVWKFQQSVATMCGYENEAHVFWSLLGAVIVVGSVVHSPALQKALVCVEWLPSIGKFSFAFYLTHLPILFTFTCFMFVRYGLTIALLGSVPVMGVVGFLFYAYVDEPSIYFSAYIAERLLGYHRESADETETTLEDSGSCAIDEEDCA